MKKILSVLLLILLTSLSSCRMGSSSIKAVKEMLSVPVKICAVINSNQKDTVEFSLYSYESESIFTFSAPKTLTHFTIKKSNDGYSAQYSGIETKINQSGIKAVDAIDFAISTIRDCDESAFTVKTKSEDGNDVIFVSIDGNNVLVYYDSSSKKIIKIVSETESQSFSYEIKEIEKINA